MSDIFEGAAGSTPLEPQDQEALVPTWIATKGELNGAEQRNIAVASAWLFGRSWEIGDLTQRWLKTLHRRMFEDVWRWAGKYRLKDTNIGLPWAQIQVSVGELILDLRSQTGDMEGHPWSADEVAVRFHHRLVSIHPFTNGNGRHARLVADALVVTLGRTRFAWGAGARFSSEGPARDEYLAALQLADREGDYGPLLAFARPPTGR
jgi:Fic-DOC domain mobile mystery protein B